MNTVFSVRRTLYSLECTVNKWESCMRLGQSATGSGLVAKVARTGTTAAANTNTITRVEEIKLCNFEKYNYLGGKT